MKVESASTDIIKYVTDIVTCLTTCQSTNSFLESVHSILNDVTYAENFYIVLKNENDDISFPYFTDTTDSFTNEELNQLQIEDLHATLTYYALQINKPCNFVFDDIVALQTRGEINLLGTKPKQWLCFPLANKGHALGAFVIQSYRSTTEYSQHTQDVLLAISHIIACALDAFKNQNDLRVANKELYEHRNKLGSLVQERTYELKLEKQKLEDEMITRQQVQCKLEQNVTLLKEEINQKEVLQKKLEIEATHDSLTGLANRNAFCKAIKSITAKNSSLKHNIFILFLDLDGFKKVNDSLGHETGDNVLVEISRRLKTHFRKNDLVARIGGDEFVILIEDIDSKKSLHLIAERIICDIERPINVLESVVNISVSIGIACSENLNHLETKLLCNADNAMYQAKRQGSGNIVWFNEH